MPSKPEEQQRAAEFKRNNQLEDLLTRLNSALKCAEEPLLASASELGAEHPVIFVMGPLRSGTTLFTQWLADSGMVAYPTNLLSRFYAAPIAGAHIQLLLTDPRYNFRNEIMDFNSQLTYQSENGKTKGALAPNEFWYFWRRFLHFGELDWMPDEELFRTVDRQALVSELTALTRVFGKPFAMKAMILNYNIPFLDAIFRQALFIHIKRDPVTNVASVLDARKRQLGSEKEWYSFKIPEYPTLKELDPVTQAAGQVHYINTAVTKGLTHVANSRKLVVQYEDFCRDPESTFTQLTQKLGMEGSDYVGLKRFEITRDKDVSHQADIKKALAYFSECH